jgi:peroxiredoxin Q/BCP
LRQDYQKFVELDAEVIVVGPEGAQAFAEYWQREDLPFVGLPNPGGGLLRQYGQEVNLFKMGRMPAQLIVDKAGRVRYVHYGKSMSDIPSNAELLSLLERLGQEDVLQMQVARPA